MAKHKNVIVLIEALKKIVEMDQDSMYERCPDCDYSSCRETGVCRIVPRSQIGKCAETALEKFGID